MDRRREPPPGLDDIRRWLEVLNDPQFDREPEENYIESRYRRDRRLTHPLYAKAAIAWPDIAETF